MSSSLEERIIRKTRQLGADLVGVADADAIERSPSHARSRLLEENGGHENDSSCIRPREAPRCDSGTALVVIALAHPATRPELDWFSSGGNTLGNSTLMRITRELAEWLHTVEGVESRPLHYYVERGGVYLKDAAVLAGLGCLGRNNLLVTPEFGPRVRLRAIMLDAALVSTGPIAFDPCLGCVEYCRHACPQAAFDAEASRSLVADEIRLAGRDGSYRRASCLVQMEQDWASPTSARSNRVLYGMDEERMNDYSAYVVKHCRRCELVCPAGCGSP